MFHLLSESNLHANTTGFTYTMTKGLVQLKASEFYLEIVLGAANRKGLFDSC